jgi:hypothetical protein
VNRSVANILLQIFGDGDDARRELAETAADIGAFGDLDAEATVDVDTSAATRSLDDIRADLARFARETAESTAGIDTAAARAQLDDLELRLHALDNETANADVDVSVAGALANIALVRSQLATLDRDFGGGGTKGIGELKAAEATVIKSISALSNETGRLGTTLDDADRRNSIFRRGLTALRSTVSDVAKEIGGFLTGPVDGFIRQGAVMSEILVPLIGGLGALLGSATLAAGGLGALAVAAGGGIVTSIGFALLAIKRFTDQSDIAGTAAHHLSQAINGLSAPFKALLPAADPVLQAIAQGLRGVGDMLTTIKPAIFSFGRDAAHAMSGFLDQLTSPRMAAGFADLIRLSGQALKPIAQIFGSLLEIATNLARAAMPFLIEIFQSFADTLKGLAQGSRNVGDLRDSVGALVGQLRAWWHLIGAIAGAWLAFARDAAPAGKQLVQFFTKGAQALADWANSEAGREKIKQFFHDTLPTAKAMVGLIGDLVKLFVSFGQTVAPALKPVIDVIRSVVQWLTHMLEKIREMHPGPIKDVALALLAFGPVVGIFRILGGLMGWIFKPLFALARLALGPVIAAVGRLSIALLTRLVPALLAVAPELAIVAAGVVAVYEGMKVGTKLADLWKSKLIDSTKLDGAMKNIQNFADAAAVATGATAKVFGQLAQAARDKVSEIVRAFKEGGPKAKAETVTLGKLALGAIKGFTGDFHGAGAQLIDALAGGQRSKEGENKNAAEDVTRAAKIAAAAFGVEFNDVGEQLGNRLAGGLQGARQAAVDAARVIGDAIKGTFQGLDLKSTGRQLGQAIVDGINSMQSAVRSTAAALGQAFASAFNAAAASAHPPAVGHPQNKVAKAASDAVTDKLGRSMGTVLSATAFALPSIPAPAAAPAGIGQVVVNSPAAKYPDARHFAAQLGILMRQRGG